MLETRPTSIQQIFIEKPRTMNFLNTMNAGSIAGSDSALQLNNVEVLYSKIQRVYIKPQHKEERQRDLRVNVEIHAGLSPVCHKSLCVLLADDNDPCFLYSLFITDDDFKVLKAQQGLLVDFDNFATQLICLLEQCQQPTTNLTKMPKFLMLLAEEAGDWCLKLVETNNFKHLCHLSLNIAPANDADIKTHMAMKIKNFKENLAQKERDIGILETRINELCSKVELKNKELEQFEQRSLTEKTQSQMTLSQQIALEKERINQAKLEWQNYYEKEKMEIERQHNESLKSLHAEIAELRTQNITYRDKQSLLDATNAEHLKLIQSLERELNNIQRDFSTIKKQNTKLEVEYHEKEKAFNTLNTKVAVLEQETKDKTILINKNAEMLKSMKEQKQKLEEILSEKDGQLQKKQAALKNLSDELVKANEILGKLQNELASAKSKLNLRTNIALEQERLLDNKQKEIGKLEMKMQNQMKEFHEMKKQLDNVTEQLKNLQMQLEEKEKTIKNNDNVINWLNKRLADIHGPFHSAPTSMPQSVQLTLPKNNKFPSNRFETRTIQNSTQPTSLSGLPLRNPIIQNLNMNQPRKNTVTSTGVGENSTGLTFRSGPISSTSTPLERSSMNKAINNQNIPHTISTSTENNNNHQANGVRLKHNSGSLQGGLKRTGFDKPLLPSAYFPKNST